MLDTFNKLNESGIQDLVQVWKEYAVVRPHNNRTVSSKPTMHYSHSPMGFFIFCFILFLSWITMWSSFLSFCPNLFFTVFLWNLASDHVWASQKALMAILWREQKNIYISLAGWWEIPKSQYIQIHHDHHNRRATFQLVLPTTQRMRNWHWLVFCSWLYLICPLRPHLKMFVKKQIIICIYVLEY